jgi:hypothetical protein
MKLLNGAILSITRPRTTVGLSEICHLGKGFGIAEGHIGDAVMSEGGETCNYCGLLATTMATSGDEHGSELAVQLSLLPKMASGVPEGLQ